MFHCDQLACDERSPTGHSHAAQPGLRSDAVLVLAKDRLQLGRRSGECCGAWSDDRGHRLCRITSALGEDADAMQLWVRRLLGQLLDRTAQAAPWTGRQRGQHYGRLLVCIESGHWRMRRGHKPLEQVDVALRIEVRLQLLSQ